jgi:hypothetical protein
MLPFPSQMAPLPEDYIKYEQEKFVRCIGSEKLSNLSQCRDKFNRLSPMDRSRVAQETLNRIIAAKKTSDLTY